MPRRTVPVLNREGESSGEVELPEVFETPFRPDVIKRAVIALQSHRFQPQGRDPMAGKRTTAPDHNWQTGHGIARIPRIRGGRRGAFIPSTVGGRAAFPPTSEKKIEKRINRKERRLAVLSGIAATADKEIVSSRGHIVELVKALPIVVEDDVQALQRTGEVRELLMKIGVWPDILRASKTKIRAGKGKMRGRKVKRRKGPLLVVAEDLGISKASKNLLGVDVAEVENLDVELLAPGAHPGRLTIWTRSAISRLDEYLGGRRG
ncbi:MAG: 50S ribosomal protein L4 [Candidatus Bathyarchaeia archaeon]